MSKERQAPDLSRRTKGVECMNGELFAPPPKKKSIMIFGVAGISHWYILV